MPQAHDQRGKVKYNGEFFQINNFKILHQPQRANIPIFMACQQENGLYGIEASRWHIIVFEAS